MIACVDVAYQDTRAVAAGIAFRDWLDEKCCRRAGGLVDPAIRVRSIFHSRAALSIGSSSASAICAGRTHCWLGWLDEDRPGLGLPSSV